MKYLTVIIGTIFLGLVSGCTWVKLTNEGEKVYVVQASELTGCTRIGTTQATGKERIGILERNQEVVAEELEALARNSAARMGGDTIVADGPVTDGHRTYVVYDCPR